MEYSSKKAVSSKFPIGTAGLDVVLEEKGKKSLEDYAMAESDQKEVERKSDQLTMATLYIEGVRNKDLKKKLMVD